jgi:DNA-3-methyladenine glycosylase
MAIQLETFLSGSALETAPRLLGCLLIRELDGRQLIGRIVETEAYDQADAASHSYKGRTPRTDVMFGPAGRAYVYFTYGMHYCFNVVSGQAGYGCGVLIRALEPLEGLDIMTENRGLSDRKQLTNGPAKLCQALAIDRSFNGQDLSLMPLRLELCPPLPQTDIVQTTRIGITKETDKPWRFYIKNNPYVSKPSISKK